MYMYMYMYMYMNMYIYMHMYMYIHRYGSFAEGGSNAHMILGGTHVVHACMPYALPICSVPGGQTGERTVRRSDGRAESPRSQQNPSINHEAQRCTGCISALAISFSLGLIGEAKAESQARINSAWHLRVCVVINLLLVIRAIYGLAWPGLASPIQLRRPGRPQPCQRGRLADFVCFDFGAHLGTQQE